MPSSLTRLGRLKVGEDHRYIVDERDKSFFWLGDTAWSIFQRLDREDVDHYMADRSSRGYTVPMAPALTLSGYKLMGNGLTIPNRYGELSLVDKDPTKPNEAWFDHVEYVIDSAASHGMYFGLLPTWAEYVTTWGDGAKPNEGPVIFDATNARIYGEYIGARFKSRTNIIWILGGDRDPPGTEDVWRAMAEGIAFGLTGEHLKWNEPHPAWDGILMTYHATGGYDSSSKTFHNDAWLGTNMIQTWAHEQNILPRVRNDYALVPPKPTIVGEPSYEGLVEGNPNTSSPWRVRYQAYWSLFAGSHGHVYGHHDMWSFAENWKDSLAAEGADDMRHVRALMESRPVLGRIPDDGVVASPVGQEHDLKIATRDAGGAYAFVYLTSGGNATVNTDVLSGEAVKAHWYDPRIGEATEAGEFTKGGPREFSAPSAGDDCDWVLVLDDASKGFEAPGK